jgi:glucokinase
MSTPAQTGSTFVGIDLSSPIVRVAVIDYSGQKLGALEEPKESERIIEQITHLVNQIRAKHPQIGSIGIAIPGLVNRNIDKVVVSGYIPATLSEDLHAELMRATGLRVELENDANAAAYGEYHLGAGRDARDMFYMTIGQGIGGAIIFDGKLWTGASGFAGEVGHMTLDTEGVECVCGNTGCLETVASAPSIVRRARERLYRDNTSSLSTLGMQKEFSAGDMAHAAREGDDFSLMMIERTGKYIGTGVASVINLLNIECIVLGGGVMDAGDLILNPIIAEARRRAFQPCFDATKIVAAELGAEAIPLGAAMLARDAQTT